MHDNMKMMNVICEELDKIADKGLTTGNLETAYKLIDMYKDLVTVDAMEQGGYSEATFYEDGMIPMDGGGVYSRADYMGGESMARGRGRNARRDAMGRYSNNSYANNMNGRSMADSMYSQAKMDYRNSRAGKDDVMSSLKEKMKELKNELKEMSRDSDFPEERKEIDKYVQMLDRVM